MADQASVRDGNRAGAGSGGGHTNGSTPEAQDAGGIAEFGNDIATLAELPSKLFLLDLKECLEHLLVPLVLVVLGVIFILAALPVTLLGVAWLLASALK